MDRKAKDLLSILSVANGKGHAHQMGLRVTYHSENCTDFRKTTTRKWGTKHDNYFDLIIIF
jgi:hypothetical protein